MTKIVIIGVDGGTLNLIIPWVKQGKLPCFAKIIKEGVYGKLRSTTPYYSAPAWVSIITGVLPGKHGIYDFFHTDCFTKKLVNSSYRKVPAIWNYLTEKNLSSIVVNVPGTYPPEKIKGSMITGLLTPSLESEYTYPKEIKKELVDGKIGRYELEQVAVDDIPKNLTARYSPEKLAEQVNMITKSHGTVTLNLMKKIDWDFDVDAKDIYDFFLNPPTEKKYNIEFKDPDKEKIIKLLVEKHDFSQERIEKHIDKILEIKKKGTQYSLGDWLKK